MKISPAPQGSAQWLQERSGIITASELHRLLTPKFELRKGEMPNKYLAEKIAEKWLGGPLIGYGKGVGQPWAMDQGQILEKEALPWLSLEWGVDILRPGFISTDDGRAGCSPDGIISLLDKPPDSTGVEIKCPLPQTHVSYLISGEVPLDYETQVHCSMFVTGYDHWRFVSYCRNFPALIINVERDAKKIQSIQDAVNWFNRRFDVVFDHLCELNGGPPPARADNSSESYSAWRRSLEAQAEEAAREMDVPIP